MTEPGDADPPSDPLLDELLPDAVSIGIAVEDAAALQALVAQLRESPTVQGYNELALRFVAIEAYANAAKTFGDLEEWAVAAGRQGQFRQSIATTYEDMGWFACSEFHLTRALTLPGSHANRDSCQQQLEMLGEAQEDDRVAASLARLTLAAAVERASSDLAERIDAERLARCVLNVYDPVLSDFWFAFELLSEAYTRYPESREICRAVLHCALVLDDAPTRDAALRRLEDLAPDSAEVTAIARSLAAGRTGLVPPAAVRYWRDLYALAADEGTEPELRVAARADLARMVDRWPRGELLFAHAEVLNLAGDFDTLAKIAERVGAARPKTYELQFYLAAVLNLLDDTESAAYHARTALGLARTDGQRRDAEGLAEQIVGGTG